VLVIDESSKKIIDNVVKEDDILNENIASKWNMKAKNDCMLSADKILRESRRRGKLIPIWMQYTYSPHNHILSIA
jgi:hypothetical protein